jgi:hypothetical protein
MSQELPRRPSCLRRLVKAQIAGFEATQQIVDFKRGDTLSSANVEELMSDTQNDGVILVIQRPFAREGDLAKRRAEMLNGLLSNPSNFPVTKQNSNIIVKQFERILSFAKTLRNKGKLNPHMARVLDMEERRGIKTSILEQIN